MTVSPAFSKRRTTSPMRLRATPSGLMMEKVRSSAMDIDLQLNFPDERQQSASAGCALRVFGEPGSLLAQRPRRNLNGGGSARGVRLFTYRSQDALNRRAAGRG